MNPHQKLTLTAAGFFLLALALLLWPSGKSVPFVGPAEATPSVKRTLRPAPLPGSRPKRDFSTFVKLSVKGEFPKLTREQIDSYLDAQHRSAGALLAAFRLSEDEAFLREAMEKFPHDPQVLLASLRFSQEPAKRLEALESLKRADPDNGIADCLAARSLFDLGRNDEAFAALSQSVGKPIRDYTVLSCQSAEEAYLGAGFSPVEAKMTALFQSTKTAILEMRNVADGMKKQRAGDESSGNDAAVQSSRDMQLQMAGQVRQGGFLLDSLVAMAVEKGVLKEIDSPEARARVEELTLQKNAMVEASKRVTALMETSAVPENDWLLYFDRVKLFGDKAANDWMLGKYPDL